MKYSVHLKKKWNPQWVYPVYEGLQKKQKKKIKYGYMLKGFATFWEFSFYKVYNKNKVADYEYHSLFAEKIHFRT